MRNVIGILLFLLAGSVQAENAYCSAPGVTFEVKENLVKFFYAQSAIEDPSLANGYTLTCVHHIRKFSQARKGNEYVLTFSEPNDQFGESLDCRVHIVEAASKYHIYTTSCVTECMKFNHRLENVGNICRNVK